MEERESIKVLLQAVDVQRKKSADYQNPRSTVQQADYYPRGIDSIEDIIHGKRLRIKSLLEAGVDPNNESLEDSYIDIINYCSFAVSWLRGKVPGQDPNKDIYNQPKPSQAGDDEDYFGE